MPAPTRYQVVLFDLDGTLRESEPRFMDALRDCLLDAGITVNGFEWRLTERWVHRYWAQSPELLEDIRLGGQVEVWPRFLARLVEHSSHQTINLTEAQSLAGRLQECYKPQSRLMPGVLPTLEALRRTGVKLGVVSNRQKSFLAELEALGIAEHFDFILAAGEIGHWKPRPEIFEEALLRAGGLSPETAVYIGDNYYADVQGAANAGLDAILVDDRRIFTDVMAPRVEHMEEVLALLDGRVG